MTPTVEITKKDQIDAVISQKFCANDDGWYYPQANGSDGISLVRVRVTEDEIITQRRRHLTTAWMSIASIQHYEFESSAFELWSQNFVMSAN